MSTSLYTGDYSVQPKKGIGYGRRHERNIKKILLKKGFFAAPPIAMDMETALIYAILTVIIGIVVAVLARSYCAIAEKVCGNHQDQLG